MTYQTTSANNDNAEEASSLLTIVTASPDPSSAIKKKNGGFPMRLMIATACFFLGTLTVVIYRGRGRSHTSSGGISADLLLGQNQDEEYAPGGYDKCYRDKDNPGKYCWYYFCHRPAPAPNNGSLIRTRTAIITAVNCVISLPRRVSTTARMMITVVRIVLDGSI